MWPKAYLFCACIVSTFIHFIHSINWLNLILSVLVIKVQIGPWLHVQPPSFLDDGIDLTLQNDGQKLERIVTASFIVFIFLPFSFLLICYLQ